MDENKHFSSEHSSGGGEISEDNQIQLERRNSDLDEDALKSSKEEETTKVVFELGGDDDLEVFSDSENDSFKSCAKSDGELSPILSRVNKSKDSRKGSKLDVTREDGEELEKCSNSPTESISGTNKEKDNTQSTNDSSDRETDHKGKGDVPEREDISEKEERSPTDNSFSEDREVSGDSSTSIEKRVGKGKAENVLSKKSKSHEKSTDIKSSESNSKNVSNNGKSKQRTKLKTKARQKQSTQTSNNNGNNGNGSKEEKEKQKPKRDEKTVSKGTIQHKKTSSESSDFEKPKIPKHPTVKSLSRKESGSLRWSTVAKEIIRKSFSDDGGSTDRRSTSSSSSIDSPGKLSRVSSRSSLLEDIAQGNLNSWDPETCVALLRIPSATNYSGIKKLIQQASQDWLEDFLSLDGLGILFESLARHGSRKTFSISDVLLQLECVTCIKAVMNSEVGLGHITRDTSYTRKLAEALGNESMMVKQQVFELLSALCMYSENGHSLALDALNNYKVYHGHRYRFQLVVDEIKCAEVPEYQASLLAFVNCIVLGESQLAARCSLRNEFLGLNFITLLDILRHCDCDAVFVQVQVFEQNQMEDQDELMGSEEYQLTYNHFEVFNELFEKIRDTPQSLQLLTILRSLCQLDPTQHSSDDVWQLLERICVRSSGGQAMSSVSFGNLSVKSTTSVGTQTVPTRLRKIREDASTPPTQSTTPGSTKLPPPPPPGIPIPPPPPPPPGHVPPPPPPPPGHVPPPPPPPPGHIPPPPPPPPGHGPPPPPPPPPPPGYGPPPPPPPPPPPGYGPPPPPPPPPSPGHGPPPPPPPPGHGPPPPPPPPGGFIPKSVGHALASASVPALTQVLSSHLPRPQSKMKRLNWSKVNAHGVLPDSVWREIAEDFSSLMPSNLDFEEIERLFCQRVIRQERKEDNKENDENSVNKKKKKKKDPSVSLVDPKTSLNLNIFLRQYKSHPDVVASYIKTCNIPKIGGDRLLGLLKILPDDNEMEVIKEYKEDPQKLGEPEKFLFHLLKIPSYRSRIEGMILMSEFNPAISVLNPQVENVIKCCESLVHHEGVKQFLAYILTLGNFINMGSYAGNANGFKLSTIPKLWETRANEAGVTLLHYIVDKTSADDSKLLDFANDLEDNLKAVERTSIDGIKTEIQTLSSEVKRIKKKVEGSDEDFTNIFEEFIKECDAILEKIEAELVKIEENRVKLSHYYCEDETKFKLEDCFNIFLTLCVKIRDAKKENKSRQERAEKRKKREEERRKMEKEREELEASGVPLRTKKGFIPPKEKEGCVVDLLLQEIKKGNFKLRKSEESAPRGV